MLVKSVIFIITLQCFAHGINVFQDSIGFIVHSKERKMYSLDVANGSYDDQTPAIMYRTSTAFNQVFYIQPEMGALRSKATTLCLDVNAKGSAVFSRCVRSRFQNQIWRYDRLLSVLYNPLTDRVMKPHFSGTKQMTMLEINAPVAPSFQTIPWPINPFYIFNLINDLVLDVMDDNICPGASLIMHEKKKASHSRNQLWIRLDDNRLVTYYNHLTLDATDPNNVRTGLFDKYDKENTCWKIAGHRIINCAGTHSLKPQDRERLSKLKMGNHNDGHRFWYYETSNRLP